MVMLDIVFVVLTVLFFIVAAAYVSALRADQVRGSMTTELFVGLLAAVGLLGYLFVALLRPERF